MKRLRFILLFIPICILLFGWGFAVGRYEAFPFSQLFAVKQRFTSERKESGPAPRPRHRPASSERPHWKMVDSHFRALKTSPTVVMLGDSITADGEWNELFPNVSIINRGIAGDTTNGLLDRIDEVISRNPRIVCLMIGINDFGREESVDAVFSRYREIVRTLSNADTNVIVQSTILPGKAISPEYHRKVAQLNRMLEKMCEEMHLTYVNLNHVLAPDGALKDDYTIDGIHLNGRGYAAWAGLIGPSVEPGLHE